MTRAVEVGSEGEFLGKAATGRAIDVPMAIVVSFGGGLMSGERFYWNLQTLLDQIEGSRPEALAGVVR